MTESWFYFYDKDGAHFRVGVGKDGKCAIDLRATNGTRLTQKISPEHVASYLADMARAWGVRAVVEGSDGQAVEPGKMKYV